MTQPRKIIVAIDGPAGAGKSTVAKAVAQRLGFGLVDTGAIYRAVALLASEAGLRDDDEAGLERIMSSLEIQFHLEGEISRVVVNGRDVTDAVRTPEISMAASSLSARSVVRRGLLDLQRRLAGEGGVVLEGRDIGTVVCPDAQVKVFLDASVEERARRRCKELQDRGVKADLATVTAEVIARDEKDMRRALAPLRPATDAIILDSTSLSVEEVVAVIVDYAGRTTV
jgi:cytidylate kinase